MFCFGYRGPNLAPVSRKTRCGRFGFLLWCLLALLSPSRAQTDEAVIQREIKAGAKALEDDKYDAAIPHFDRAIALLKNPKNQDSTEALAWAFYGRAGAHYSMEQWELAVADYNRYLELNPNDAEALSLRGVARKAMGDYDGLMADSQRAAKIDPQYEHIVEAAESTILRRRGFLALWIFGCLILALGAIPFVKAIVHVSRLESQARKSGLASERVPDTEGEEKSGPKD